VVRADESVIGSTESVCPKCLRRLPAHRVASGEDVYLVKTCPEHGKFRTIIWRGQPAFDSWPVPKQHATPPVCATAVEQGCPFDCGLCPAHRQHTCCVLLEVTDRCNLACPFCFAASLSQGNNPDLGAIEGWYRMLIAFGGPFNIQLSGGEPTLRNDLPEIIALGRSLGFSFFQLNTNGIRLASEAGYAQALKDAGLSCVFLQFDGVSDEVYKKIRGISLLKTKKTAIARCNESRLGVVLVPTLVPGINISEIGPIIGFAISMLPAVRGVHFQPVSYFGRYPKPPDDSDRITIPEILREIERQTGGMMKAGDFRPPTAENPYCSFNGSFVLMENGELKPRQVEGHGCCGSPRTAADCVRKAQVFVARKWSAGSAPPAGRRNRNFMNTASLDAFLSRVENYSLCISGMAFQDAWNLDLDRLRECFIHVVNPDAKIVPFCAYNLTDASGQALYRPQRSPQA